MDKSDSQLEDLLNHNLKGTDVVCCKGFTDESALRGKLISLVRNKKTIDLRATIGDEIFESSISLDNLGMVTGKKQTKLLDEYSSGGNVWILGI